MNCEINPLRINHLIRGINEVTGQDKKKINQKCFDILMSLQLMSDSYFEDCMNA